MAKHFAPLASVMLLVLGCSSSADDGPSAALAAAPDAGAFAETGSREPDSSGAVVPDSAPVVDAGSAKDAPPQAHSDATVADSATPKDTGGAQDAGPATLCELTPDELHAALATKDFLLIDVHHPYAGTIPETDARIPDTDIAGLAAFIGPDLDTKVVLTCLHGGMSATAGAALVAKGYRAICELAGGMTEWTRAGYALDRDGG
jgi:rhodanese-related sulfurtransferase